MSREDAAHLLRRAGFGGSSVEIDQLATLDRSVAVDRFLDTSLAPPAPEPAFLNDVGLQDWEKHVRAQLWWLERMRTTPAPLVEKLTADVGNTSPRFSSGTRTEVGIPQRRAER